MIKRDGIQGHGDTVDCTVRPACNDRLDQCDAAKCCRVLSTGWDGWGWHGLGWAWL